MERGNAWTAAVAVLVFLLMLTALWTGQEWWFIVPVVGYIILVPFVFFLIGEY